MKAIVFLTLVTGLFFCGCSKSNEPAKSSTQGGNPLTAPADYLDAMAKAKKSADKTVTGVGIQQTIQLFFAQEGRFPKDLNELVKPDYLSALPAPPNGMKYDYNAQTGVFKVVPK